MRSIQLIILCLLACILPRANGALIKTVSFSQGANSATYLMLQNNDAGAIYDSAELKIQELFLPVALAVQAYNSDYADKTTDEIISEWAVGIIPGEIWNGWNSALNNGVLDLSHIAGGAIPDLDYTVWYNTIDNSAQDEMAITVYFSNQLDFNHNGLFDAASEALYQTDQPVSDAFVGINGISSWSGSGTSYSVVPEPATAGLLGLGVVLALALKKLRTFYAR